jgi:hypothetical protein
MHGGGGGWWEQEVIMAVFSIEKVEVLPILIPIPIHACKL